MVHELYSSGPFCAVSKGCVCFHQDRPVSDWDANITFLAHKSYLATPELYKDRFLALKHIKELSLIIDAGDDARSRCEVRDMVSFLVDRLGSEHNLRSLSVGIRLSMKKDRITSHSFLLRPLCRIRNLGVGHEALLEVQLVDSTYQPRKNGSAKLYRDTTRSLKHMMSSTSETRFANDIDEVFARYFILLRQLILLYLNGPGCKHHWVSESFSLVRLRAGFSFFRQAHVQLFLDFAEFEIRINLDELRRVQRKGWRTRVEALLERPQCLEDIFEVLKLLQKMQEVAYGVW